MACSASNSDSDLPVHVPPTSTYPVAHVLQAAAEVAAVHPLHDTSHSENINACSHEQSMQYIHYMMHGTLKHAAVVSRYYDTAGIRKKYLNIQTMAISSINF